MIDLLPCPFCGGPAEIWRTGVHQRRPAWVACLGRCATVVTAEHATDDAAIETWNSRSGGGNIAPTFQRRVDDWVRTCFGPEAAADKAERNHRFLEESLELVQSLGCTRDEAMDLVDYVYGRPVGDPPSEVGGVTVTLAALCNASGVDIATQAETELARIWTKVEQIRRKQATKPKGARPQ